MLPYLSQELLRRWDTIFPKTKSPGLLNYLGIAGSVEGGTTTYLGFGDGQIRPYFAVKVHRDGDAESRIRNEQEVLDRLQKGTLSLAATVPEVFFSGNIEGTWVIVESIVEGSPMNVRLTENGTPDLREAQKNLQIIDEWLQRLARETHSEDNNAQRELVCRGNETIDQFRQFFSLETSEKQFLDRLQSQLPELCTSGGSFQHGDFCRQNILIFTGKREQQLNVIDWTDSRPLGFPLHDLFFFTTSYYLQLRKKSGVESFLEAFEKTFFKKTPYGTLIQKTIASHCQKRNIDPQKIFALYALFLMNQSLFEYHKMARYGSRGGLPRFVLYLAFQNKKSFQEALKEQVWIYFFRLLIKNEENFILL